MRWACTQRPGCKYVQLMWAPSAAGAAEEDANTRGTASACHAASRAKVADRSHLAARQRHPSGLACRRRCSSSSGSGAPGTMASPGVLTQHLTADGQLMVRAGGAPQVLAAASSCCRAELWPSLACTIWGVEKDVWTAVGPATPPAKLLSDPLVCPSISRSTHGGAVSLQPLLVRPACGVCATTPCLRAACSPVPCCTWRPYGSREVAEGETSTPRSRGFVRVAEGCCEDMCRSLASRSQTQGASCKSGWLQATLVRACGRSRAAQMCYKGWRKMKGEPQQKNLLMQP